MQHILDVYILTHVVNALKLGPFNVLSLMFIAMSFNSWFRKEHLILGFIYLFIIGTFDLI
jgi:hypothetical protein